MEEFYNIIEINTNNSSNIILKNNFKYVIIGEVHILENINLIIEENVVIYIRNGIFPKSKINRSVLIFDSGSTLIASTFFVLSCNEKNIPVTLPDNGGLWFLGTASDVNKDGISSKYSSIKSNFSANKIYTYYLGSYDPIIDIDHPSSSDQDSITLLGCGKNEWNILSLYIQESGDNALDIVESYVTINDIEVVNPGEDAINIQSGQLNVLKTLKLYVPLTNVKDRDIFDFETDNGFSFLRIERFCYVEIFGIFGDQLSLVSNDIPQDNNKIFYYKGITTKGQSYIYSGIRLIE